MALDKKIATIPFTGGIQTKKTDVLLEPGELEVLENGVFNKHGQIEKRKGYTEGEWTAASNWGKTRAAFGYMENLYMITAEGKLLRMDPDNPSYSSGMFQKMGAIAPFQTELFPATAKVPLHHCLNPSIAVSGDGTVIAVAYIEATFNYTSNAVNYRHRVVFIDKETMTIFNATMDDQSTGSGVGVNPGKIKVVAATSSYGFAVYWEFKHSGGYQLRRKYINPKSLNFSVGLASGGVEIAGYTNNYNQTTSQQWFDVCASLTSNDVHVAYYKNNSGTHSLHYVKDNDISSNTSTADLDDATDFSTGLGGTIPDSRIAIGVSSLTTPLVYIGYRTGATVRVQRFADGGPGSATSATHSDSNWEPENIFTWNYDTGSNDNALDAVSIDGHTQGASASKQKRKLLICNNPSGTLSISTVEYGGGRHGVGPFSFDTSNGYGATYTYSALSSSEDYASTDEYSTIYYQKVPTTTGTTTGDTNLSGWSVPQAFRLEHSDYPCKTVVSGSYAYTALPISTNINTFPDGSGGTSVAVGSVIKIVRYSLDFPDWGVSYASLGKNVFYTCGNGVFRTGVDEVASPAGMPKPQISAIAVSSGGNLTASKAYKYKVVFEFEDSAGNLYRSEPSDAASVSSTGSDKTASVTVEHMGAPSTKGINGHRVVLYRTQGDGNIYNKVQTRPGADSDGGTLVFTDDISDNAAAGGAFLYTDAGELVDTRCPPAFYLESHRNRLFLISEDNRIFFSKEYEEAYGVAFSDTFTVPLDGLDDDKPTALGSAGNALYIFRENSIWAISGDGPTKTGTGSYYTPQLVSGSIGALKGSPTLFTDQGMFFQSKRGIHVVSANGVEYIGSPVEDVLGDSRIRDIILDQETSTIRFITSTSVIVYCYEFGQWSHFTYSTLGNNTIIGAGNWDGTNRLVTSDDKIWKETGSKLASTYLVMKLRTGWISLNEIQGFGRAYRFALLGKSQDKHVLNVKVYYDYDDSAAVDTYSFTTSSATDAVLQFRAHLSKQKCQAIKFEIYDADNSASAGDGFVIESIAVEIGTKRGIFRTPESNTIGAS